MLTINSRQREAMQKTVRAPFHERIFAFLRETMPDCLQEQTEAQVRLRIDKADRDARSYGIRTERGITQFAALCFVAGEKFHELPEVEAFLRSSVMEPDARIDWLLEQVVERTKKNDP